MTETKSAWRCGRCEQDEGLFPKTQPLEHLHFCNGNNGPCPHLAKYVIISVFGKSYKCSFHVNKWRKNALCIVENL